MSIPVKHMVHLPPLHISLPISTYFKSPINVDTICSRMSSFPLPRTWSLRNTTMPLTLCKLQTTRHHPPKVDTIVTLSVSEVMKFEWTFIHHKLTPNNCKAMETELPSTVSSLSDVGDAMSLIDSCTVQVCAGNSDANLMEIWQQRSLTLHGSSGIF